MRECEIFGITKIEEYEMYDYIQPAYDPDYMKRKLRRKKVSARDSLTSKERREKSSVIVQNILDSDFFKKAETVMLYRAVRGEVQLDTLPNLAPDKKYVYPLCIDKTQMRAYKSDIADERAWKKGAFGIPEPNPAYADEVNPEQIDLVICPCTAFDRDYNRLGMGAGYYDRYLEKCENAHLVAVAFDVQEAREVPVCEYDVKMKAVITEAGIRCETISADADLNLASSLACET